MFCGKLIEALKVLSEVDGFCQPVRVINRARVLPVPVREVRFMVIPYRRP